MANKSLSEGIKEMNSNEFNPQKYSLSEAIKKANAAEEYTQATGGNVYQFDVNEYAPYVGDVHIGSGLDKERARRQSGTEQLGHAAAKIVPNTLISIAENVGSIVDFNSYLGEERDFGNAITEWAQGAKESVNDALPIYRVNPEQPLDVSDSAWWYENGSGLVESAAAFVATGYGVGALTGGVLTKGAQAAKWLSTSMKTGKGISTLAKGGSAQRIINLLNTGTNAVALNQAEGLGIATTLYNNVYEEELKITGDEELARKKASDAASYALNINRANILLNLTSANLFVKPFSGVSTLVKNPTLKRSLGRIAMEGAQEYAEEVVNLYAELDAERANMGLNDRRASFQRLINDATTLEGLEAGILGFVGGAVQTGGSLAFKGKERDKQREAYQTQQAILEERTNLWKSLGSNVTHKEVFSALTDQANILGKLKTWAQSGDPALQAKAEVLKKKSLHLLAYQAFQTGTTESLRSFYEDIQNKSEEEALTEQFPENYKEGATQALDLINKLEEEYYKSTQYEVGQPIYQNRANVISLRKDLDSVRSSLREAEAQARQDIQDRLDDPTDSMSLKDGDTTLPFDVSKLSENTSDSKVYDAFLAEAETMPSVQLVQKLNRYQQNLLNSVNKHNEGYAKMVTPDWQKKEQEARKKRQQAAEEENEALENAETTLDAALEEEMEERQKAEEDARLSEDAIKAESEEVLDEKERQQDARLSEDQVKREGAVKNPLIEEDAQDDLSGDIEVSQETIPIPKNKTALSNLTKAEIQQLAFQEEIDVRSDDNKKALIDKVSTALYASDNKSSAKKVIKKYKDTTSFTDDKLKDAESNNRQLRKIIKRQNRQIEEEETNETIAETEARSPAIPATGAAMIASSARNYEGSGPTGTLKAVDNELNPNYNTDLSNPDKLKPDSKLTFKVADESWTGVDNNGNIITYQEIMSKVSDDTETTSSVQDIERRRQEELDNGVTFQNIRIGDTLQFYDTNNRGFRRLPTETKIIKSISERRIIFTDGSEIYALGIDITSKDVETRVNAKYDAELAALDRTSSANDFTDYVPIEILDENGVVIGMVHTKDFINPNRVKEENVESEKAKLRLIREKVLENGGELSGKVVDKSNGVLFYDKDGKYTTTETALAGDEVQFAIVFENRFVTGLDEDGTPATFSDEAAITPFELSEKLEGDATVDGHVFAMVPNANGTYIPTYLKVNRLRDTYVNSIRNAVQAWYKPEKHSATITWVKDEFGIDLSTSEGLRDYIQMFTRTLNYKSRDAKQISFDLRLKAQNHGVSAVDINTGDNTIRFGTNGEAIDSSTDNMWKYIKQYDSITDEEIKQKSDNAIQDNLDLLAGKLARMFVGINLDHMGNTDFKLPIINKADANTTDEVGTIEQHENGYTGFIKHNTATNIMSKEVDNGDGTTRHIYTINSRINYALDDVNALDEAENRQNVRLAKDVRVKQEKEPTKKEEYDFGDVDTQLDELGFATINEDGDIETEGVVERIPTVGSVSPIERKILIDGVSANIQKLIVNHLANQFNAQIAYSEFERGSLVEFLKGWKARFGVIKQAAADQGKTGMVNLSTAVEKNFDVVARMVAFKVYGFKTTEQVNRTEEFLEDFIQEVIDETSEDTEQWDDNSQFTTNQKARASVTLRVFMSGVKKLDSNNNPVTWFGIFNEYVGFDEVMDELNSILAVSDYNPSINPSVENMIARIRQFAKNNQSKQWLLNVADRIEAANPEIQNQFVEFMHKHHAEFLHMQYKQDENGDTVLTISTANASSNIDKVIHNWKDSILNSDLVIEKEIDVEDEEGEATTETDLVWNPDVKNDIITLIGKLRSKHNTVLGKKKKGDDVTLLEQEQYQLIRQIFDTLGLTDVSNDLIRDINEGKLKDKWGDDSSLEDQLSQYGGIFRAIEISLNRSDVSLQNNSSDEIFYNDNAFRQVAIQETQYTDNVYSNTIRDGVNTIWSYTDNHYVSNRYARLKSDDTLLQVLNTQAFSNSSSWLNTMASFDEEGKFKARKKNTFTSNFKFRYLALNAARNEGRTKGADTMSMEELEYLKAGYLWNHGMSDYNRKGQRIVNYFYPTLSDKKKVVLIRAIAESVSMAKDGKISDATAQRLYDTVFRAELDRMLSPANINSDAYKQGKGIFFLFPELNKEKQLFNLTSQDKALDEEGNPKPFENKGNHTVNRKFAESKEGKKFIRERIKEMVGSLVADKVKDWENAGIDQRIDKQHLSKLGHESATAEAIQHAAADMVVNYLIANTNIAQMFTGDIAQYYKSGETVDEIVANTFDNFGKRLAGDVAPGREQQHKEGETIRYGVVDDDVAESLNIDYIRKLAKREGFAADVDAYANIEATDAQEWTTEEEHLRIMEARGLISPSIVRDIKARREAGKKLTTQQIGVLFAPMKPVYSGNVRLSDGSGEQRFYVKSSSIPLIPELVKGTPLEKVLESMKKNSLQRLAFKTAVKVGIPSDTKPLFTKGEFIEENLGSIRVMEVPREGFRIQQEVPVKETNLINDGTQQRKMLMANMQDLIFRNGKKGAEILQDLELKYSQIWKAQRNSLLADIIEGYEEGDNLAAKFEVGEVTINHEKFNKILTEEAASRGWTPNDINTFDIVRDEDPITGKLINQFRVPLSFSPSVKQIENLLSSIIDNRIRKIKAPGRSYVLVSETGFNAFDANNDIIFTDNYDEELGRLKPQGEPDKDGNRTPAQVFISQHIKTIEGDEIDLTQYTITKNGRTYIDNKRLPKELLEQFSFRIPTQGLQSTSTIQIAGFLPKAFKNAIVAPRDFVAQMGSDFDIDKLYANEFSIAETAKGELVKVTSKNRDSVITEAKRKLFHMSNNTHAYTSTEYADRMEVVENLDKIIDTRVLQNEILDIHMNVANDGQYINQRPVTTGKLKKIGADIQQARKDRGIGNTSTIYISDKYQTFKYSNASAGKAAVGTFASNLVMNAMMQDRAGGETGGQGIYPTITVQGKEIDITPNFNHNGFKATKMDAINTHNLQKKLDVISHYLSAAVDNEKEQILDKLNINQTTMTPIGAMFALGYDEELISYIMNQDSIYEYVEALNSRRSLYSNTYDPQLENKLKGELFEKYMGKKFKANHKWLKTVQPNMNLEVFKKTLKNGQTDPAYNEVQAYALHLVFNLLQEQGQALRGIQQVASVEAQGSRGYIEKSLTRQRRLESIVRGESGLKNIVRVFGRIAAESEVAKMDRLDYMSVEVDLPTGKTYYNLVPTTLYGHAFINTVPVMNMIFQDQFYHAGNRGKQAIDRIVKQANRDFTDKSIEEEATFRMEVWDNVKAFYYAKLLGDNTQDRRRELVISEKEYYTKNGQKRWRYKRESLAAKIRKYRKNPNLPNRNFITKNDFIKRLFIESEAIKGVGTADYINYRSDKQEGIDELDIHAAFKSGLESKIPEIRQIFTELVEYAVLMGGARGAVDFTRYIPQDYLEAAGWNNALRTQSFENVVTEDDLDDLAEQFFLNNPKYIRGFDADNVAGIPDDLSNTATIDTDPTAHDNLGITDDNDVFYLYPLITIKDKKGHLTIWKAEGSRFVQQQRLGSRRGRLEYFPLKSGQVIESVFRPTPKYLTKTTDVKPDGNNRADKPVHRKEAITKTDSTNDYSDFDTYKESTNNSTEKVMSLVADDLEAIGEKGMATVAKRIAPYIKNTKLVWSEENGRPEYSEKNNTITMRRLPQNDEVITLAILHEGLHAATVTRLRNPKTDSEKKASKELNYLVTLTKNKLGITADEIKKAVAKSKNNQTLTVREGLAYAVSDNAELITMVLQSPKIREELNSIKTNKASLWDRFKKTIMQLFGIEPGTVAGDAMGVIFELTEDGRKTPIGDKLKGVKDYNVDNVTYSIKIVDGKYDVKVKSTNNDPASETLRNKVIVNYEIQNGKAFKVQDGNKQYVILSDNRIISLQDTSKGKEVYTDPNNGVRKKLLRIREEKKNLLRKTTNELKDTGRARLSMSDIKVEQDADDNPLGMAIVDPDADDDPFSSEDYKKMDEHFEADDSIEGDEFLYSNKKSKLLNIIRNKYSRKRILQKRLAQELSQGQNRQAAKTRQQINAITDDIHDLEKNDGFEYAIEYGKKDIAEVKAMLNEEEVSPDELLFAKKVIGLWGNATKYFLTEAERRVDSEIKKQFEELERQARRLEDKNLKLQKLMLKEFVKRTTGRDLSIEELLNIGKDIGGIERYLLDMSRRDSFLLQALSKGVKDADFRGQQEFREMLKTIEDHISKVAPLLEAYRGKDGNLYDIFKQRDSKGRLTTAAVHRYTQDFFDTKHTLMQKAKKSGNPNDWSTVFKWKEENEIVFDPRKLMSVSEMFTDEEDININMTNGMRNNAVAFGDNAKRVLENQLKDQLGEKGYKVMMETFKKAQSQYAQDYQINKDLIYDDVSLDDAQKKVKLSNWVKTNSPYWYTENIKAKGYIFGSEKIKPQGYKYLKTVPRKVDTKGKPTQWYDKNFQTIESKPELLEFYEFMTKTFNDLYKIIPENERDRVQMNTLPQLEKSVGDLMTESGVMAAGAKIYDNIFKVLKTEELSTVSKEDIDPDTGVADSTLRPKMIPKKQQRINELVRMKIIDFKSKNKNNPTPEDKARFRAEAKDEVAQDLSYDMEKLLKGFAAVTLGYKHKSRTEDYLKIAQNVLETLQEKKRNKATGEVVTDTEGNSVLLDEGKSFTNIKESLDYFMQATLYGNSRDVEGAYGGKIYTTKEKQEKARIEGLIDANDRMLRTGRIDKETHQQNADALNGYLNKLGSEKTLSGTMDAALRWTQLKGMGWNVMAATANIGFGDISSFIEAAAGEQFTIKEFTKARLMVHDSLLKNWSMNTIETGRAKKIRALMDKLDTLKESSKELYSNSVIGRQNKWWKRFMPYQLQKFSEYFVQAPNMIAMMLHTKVGDKTLWDMFDENGDWIGEENTDWAGDMNNAQHNKEMLKFKNRLDATIARLHGNYDPLKPIEGKRKWYGRALLQFRTWALEGFANRFGEFTEDDALGFARKGRYRTLVDGDLKKKLLSLVSKQARGELAPVDVANMRRNAMELGIYISFALMGLLAKLAVGEVDDEDKWAWNLVINNMLRVSQDLEFYVSPTSFEDITKQSVPAARTISDSIGVLEAAVKLLQGEDEIEGGIYDGQSRMWRNSLKGVPMGNKITQFDAASRQIFD